MGGCDSLSPLLLGFSSSFPLCGSAQSHYKAIKGYELVSAPTQDQKKKKSLHLHKYGRKYTRAATQTHKKEISPQKSSRALTNTLSVQVVEQSLRPNRDSAPKTFNFINYPCEALYSTPENSIIYRAAHHQLKLSSPTFCLAFIFISLQSGRLKSCISIA